MVGEFFECISHMRLFAQFFFVAMCYTLPTIHRMLFMESSLVRATGLLSLATRWQWVKMVFSIRTQWTLTHSPLCVLLRAIFTGRKKAVAGASKWIIIALAMFMWTELQIWISFSSWFEIMREFSNAPKPIYVAMGFTWNRKCNVTKRL